MASNTPSPESAKPQPRNTLEVLILYPALALAIVGAIPTVIQHLKAWRLDTTAAKVALVEEQQALWTRNLACIGQSSTWEVDVPGNVVIKITVCQRTGDILARYFQNEWEPQYRWLRRPDPTTRRKSGGP